MLQGRLFAYADAHRYRLGVNHTRLAVNAPHATQVALVLQGRWADATTSTRPERPGLRAELVRGPAGRPGGARGRLGLALGRRARACRRDPARATTTTGSRPGRWCDDVMDDAARDRLVTNIVGSHVQGRRARGPRAGCCSTGTTSTRCSVTGSRRPCRRWSARPTPSCRAHSRRSRRPGSFPGRLGHTAQTTSRRRGLACAGRASTWRRMPSSTAARSNCIAWARASRRPGALGRRARHLVERRGDRRRVVDGHDRGACRRPPRGCRRCRW